MRRVGKPRCKAFVNEATHAHKNVTAVPATQQGTHFGIPSSKGKQEGSGADSSSTSGLILGKVTSTKQRTDVSVHLDSTTQFHSGVATSPASSQRGEETRALPLDQQTWPSCDNNFFNTWFSKYYKHGQFQKQTQLVPLTQIPFPDTQSVTVPHCS